MGKSRPRAAEKRVLGQGSIVLTSSSLSTIPSAPVYYPTEDEFKDPLAYIYKIRPEAELFGICKIVPPENWKPPFALDLDKFTFPTKTQAIHQLQARPPACNSKTFELEYNRFLEEHCGKKVVKKKVVFEGKELDLCRLFNGVKRYGGYDNVEKEKKWEEVFRFVRSGGKVTKCSKYVLCQLYKEHLYDYEVYYSKLDRIKEKSCKRGMDVEKKGGQKSCKRSRVSEAGEKVETSKVLEEQVYDQICEQCRSGLHAEVMLLCDRCNKGWHIYCLSPPLKRVPPGNWYCSECFNSEKDSFGFVPGKQLSLEAFRCVADRAKKKWLGSTSVSRAQLEKKFWEIVEGSVGEVEVIYGSDLDTSVYGSGFPRVDDQRPSSIEIDGWDEYCASPWNLNNLPKLQGSMLRAVHHNIAGVMVPWLYIGMLFSSFCWHFEDHCFYSMNYHHWGEPKCWYSVPGNEASAFEKVMRNSLPDLFDAQPDLLFQLVTMLNPSVLQENNVPVYSVLQEPGNFVITFPRSYHGGFNFGLNCAEAVNFAPADWLPYGGFGAELYQHYRKPTVLSHEELLCVVAKNNFDGNALSYLKNELLRVYNKEKSWRERLWKNGIIRSSPMAPRKQPSYVGVEEDAACIICQQFLYLSAVGCSCRPSAFVCLEHWENLCECKPRKRHFLYRHTLAELNDLVVMKENPDFEEMTQKRNKRTHLTCPNESPPLSKKVKDGHVTITQLAEEWILRSCKILQMPYSNVAYATALKEAEQFLWAGSEMDPVRELAKNLVKARKWAEGVRDCLSKVELWSSKHNCEMERVNMEDLTTLLNVSPVPCNEPGHLKLKGHEEEAEMLIQEICLALSTSSNIADLETLYSKACESAIYVKETDELSTKLSAVKLWLHTVRKCISEKAPGLIEVDVVNDLKSKIAELQLQVPEIPMFLDLVSQVELCQSRCTEMLKGPIALKNLELLVQEYDGFTVNVPELKLLRQYQSDAFDWISRFNNVVKNINEREDQENVVNELKCLEKDGSLLKVQVDEIPLVDVELKKAFCRVEAWKILRSKMPLESIQQVIAVANELQIENEMVFKKISDVLAQAVCLEEKAKHILATEVQLSDFEDVVRMSEDLCALLPSIDGVKTALSMAKSWLTKSKPYLDSDFSMSDANPLLNVDMLKELVSESKLLKVYLDERSLLEDVLQNYMQWESNAYTTLHDAESLLNILNVGDESSYFISKISDQAATMESIMKDELSHRFDSPVIAKLQETCAIFHWCFKALAFRAVAPTLKEIEMLLEDAERHHVKYASCSFWRLLVDGIIWLKRAVEILGPCNVQRFDLSDVEEALRQSKILKVSFPLIVGQLHDAINRHNVWVDVVKEFFSRSPRSRSWFSLMQLEGLGSTDAFNCMEMDLVTSEMQKVKEWKQRCGDIVGVKVPDDDLLLNALSQILDSLDRSLYVYKNVDGCTQRSVCIFCSDDYQDQELSTCSVCMDCYHMQCIKPIFGGTSNATTHICPYCHIVESGKVSRLKIDTKRTELGMLIELLSDAKNLCVEIKEKAIIHRILEKFLAYKDCLVKTSEFSLASLGKDPSVVFCKLSTALKAIEVAGVYERETNCKFELALARNSWRVRASKLLDSSQKPSMQQIQRLLKEGLAINVPLEDYFWHRLETIRHFGLQWAAKAKKVSGDSGALELHKVFELITEGENSPVHFDKELKLLRERSMLYCICRKPYDQRAMIACDKCDEWYHFDCINLASAPKNYICPACKVDVADEAKWTSSSVRQERSYGECEEPQTPSPRPVELRRELEKFNSNATRKIADSDDISTRRRSGIERLLWRNRKPFRRMSKRRVELEVFSPFFHVQ